MRRSLLNKRILPKPLRQALVLFTLLLLPNAAWGQTEYPLYIAGTQVTSENAANFFNDETKTVSFTPSDGTNPATLTLNNATISRGDGAPAISLGETMEKLVIDIKGTNTIQTNDDTAVLAGNKMGSNQEDYSSIEFTSSTGTGSLTLQRGGSTPGVISFGYMDLASLNVSYNGLDPTYLAPEGATSLTTATQVQISVVDFNLTVAGVAVTSTNKDDILEDGKVSFTPAEGDDFATLTLNNATLNGGIIWKNGSNALTVKLDGMNYIETSTNDPAFKATASCYLYIKKNNPDNDATVKFSGSIVDFNSQLDDGFKQIFDAITPCSYYTTKTVYGISIGGTDLHDISGENGYLNTSTGAITGMDDVVSFTLDNPDSYNENTISTWSTLTLNNATINGGIVWSQESEDNNLSILVNGTCNVINRSTESTPSAIKYTTGTATPKLSISKGSGNDATLILAAYQDTGSSIVPSTAITGFNTNVTTDLQKIEIYPDNNSLDKVKHTCYTTAAVYDLHVAGIQVHEISNEYKGYINNVLGDTGDPTVSYGDGVLTLNNAEIVTSAYVDGIVIGSTLSNLSINLKGTNNITTEYGNSISGQGDVAKNASIISSSAPAGTLTLSKSSGVGLISNINLNTEGWTVTYPSSGTSLAEANQAIISKGTITGLKIAGTLITSEYLENGVISSDVSGITDGTVSFTETPATLTLDGAKITGTISWTKSAPLTIAIKGTNSVTTTGGPAIEGNYQDNTTLTFSKVSETGKCKLILSGSSDASISGFNNNSNTYAGSGLVYYADSSEDGITATISSTLSGGGTSTDPYLIETSEDFKDFAIFVDRGFITNEYIKLNVNDYIDCSNLEDFETIGNSLYKFTGTFDGNEKTIKNLSVKGKGLFYTDSYAPIKVIKLTLDHLTVTGLNTYSGQIGAIASELWSGEDSEPWKDEIEGCVVKNSLITCENNFGNPWIGGIVGANYGGTITNCIVEDTEITASTENTGESGANSKAGGIVCYNSGSISGCQVKGNTIVTAAHTISSDVSAGAIVCMNGATGFTNNTYEYTVKTQTKGSGDNGYNTKDKYTHRGTGSANYDANSDEGDKDPEGIAMYTKKVIIPLANNQQSGGNVGNVMVDLYYMKSGEDNTIYNVAPGEEIVLFVEYYALKGSYTLNGETEPITLKNTESNDWYSFDMPDADVTFTLQEAAIVHFSEEGEQSFATYYNATKDMAVPMGMTAYMVTGISEDGTKIIVSPVSYIKAGVAVLIEKDKTTEVSETTDFSGSKLVYAENDVPATENTKLYVLYNNKYVKVTAGTKILSGSCYLNLSGVANTRGFYEIGGGEGTTSLREVKTDVVNSENWTDGEWFTLQGQRVAKPAKGLYILNGKKVVVK